MRKLIIEYDIIWYYFSVKWIIIILGILIYSKLILSQKSTSYNLILNVVVRVNINIKPLKYIWKFNKILNCAWVLSLIYALCTNQ